MIGTQPNIVQAILNISGDPNNYPQTNNDIATRWADVADDLLSQVIPQTTTQAAARQAFIGVMMAIDPTVPNGLLLLEQAFVAYAAAIAAGMQPTFTGTPPPAPPPIVATLNTPNDAQTAANLLATLLCTWAITGTAVNNSSGASSLWA